MKERGAGEISEPHLDLPEKVRCLIHGHSVATQADFVCREARATSGGASTQIFAKVIHRNCEQPESSFRISGFGGLK